MAKLNTVVSVFNRGLLGRLGLARVDLDRTALSAEVFENWIPRVLGSMSLRPGWKYLTSTKDDARAFYLPFVFASDDKALIELTDEAMRVLVDDEVISRPTVTASVTNGEFTSNLSGWTDADESGATSSHETGGYLSLQGDGTNFAIRRQEVTVNETDTEHALRIVIERGLARLRVGSSAGEDDYIEETELGTGTHSLAFTPSGNFFIEFASRTSYSVLVNSVAVESSGDMEIPAPFAEADLPLIRFDESADVVFLACQGYQQRRIERRATRSWSIVLYEPPDGPFRVENPTNTTISASDISGDVTLTASKGIFRDDHVGALFSIDSVGQEVQSDISAENTFTNEIRISGVGDDRQFSISVAGTWGATVTLQRSISEPGTWVDVEDYSSNTTKTFDDGFDNQIVYYRIGVKTGDYTSGTVDASLSYPGGSITGYARITEVNSGTEAEAVVLKELGATTASEFWSEGAWSDLRGYPTSVALYEGRLWWAGRSNVWGSVSDAYESFDDTVEGDSGPISRTIGSGPVDIINWLAPLQRLILGTDGSERNCRSTSFDEPLTPTNFNIKGVSTQGSAKVGAAIMDTTGLFVQRSGSKLFELTINDTGVDYSSHDLTSIVPEVGEPSITKVVVQRQPDTRVHCVRSDGKVAMLVFDVFENVLCWLVVSTDGDIEDAVVLPGTKEDQVYYVVRRTINGSTKRYLERWALQSECVGGDLNRQADAFVEYDGVATTTISGLDHLEGEDVVAWADGRDVGTKTVSSGEITLDTAAQKVIAGLPYTARWKSTKLAYGANMGTALIQRKRVDHVGLILADTHYQGIQYGPDFDHLDDLPLVEAGAITDDDTVWESFDSDSFTFDGPWDTDSRVCLQAAAPRPATVLALVASMQTHDKG